MDFAAHLTSLVEQIPEGRVARLADVARALGDVRASAAVATYLRDHPDVPGADRIVRSDAPGEGARTFSDFQGPRLLAGLRAEQKAIAARVSRRTGFRTMRTIGGVDVAYDGDHGFACLVLLRWRDLEVVDQVLLSRDVTFPYIPTYLAFREFPLIERAIRRLDEPPDVLLVDGHGRMHPLRCGVACFVGVKLDLPTVGVAKRPLVGAPARTPSLGEAVPIRRSGETLGVALRTSLSGKPLYVSTGHRVALRTAVRIIRDSCRTRHPEPLRIADATARSWKMKQKKKR